jgi:hypothetical protein
LSKNNSIKYYFRKEKIKKMLLRIFKPFISAQILLVTVYIFQKNFSIKGFLAGGGIGPGSYYPWIYLQLWVLIPFMFLIMKKNAIIGSIVIILFSLSTNILFVMLGSSDWLEIPFINGKKEAFIALYRLCVTRYIFIFPLVFLLIEQKLNYNILLFLGFIGAGFIYCMDYKNINFEPLFYNSGWQEYEFPSNFYTLLVFIFLFKIYSYIPIVLQDIVNKIGKHSWKIFNMQMIYFTLCGYLNINKYLNLVLSLFICIIPIYTYKFMEKPIEI